MSAPGYARVVPVLRVLYSRLYGSERIRELAATASLDDVLSGIRDSLYGHAAEQRLPERVAAEMYRIYHGIVSRVASLAPPQGEGVALYFTRADELEDSMVLAYRASSGQPGGAGGLPTAAVRGTLAWRAAQEPDVASSVQRLLEAAPRWLRPLLATAERAASSQRDSWVFLLARPALKALLLWDALERAEARGRVEVSRILCPALRAEAAAAALNAVALGAGGRSLEAAWRPAPRGLCGLDWAAAAAAAAREEDPSAVAAALRQSMPDLRLEGRAPLEQAAAAIRWGRLAARRRAEAAFQGYPFHAGLLAAGLLLARLELEDLRAIVLSTYYRLHSGTYGVLLSRPGIA